MFNSYMSAISGGLLIGLASILLFLGIGRIAGISGIFWRSLSNQDSEEGEPPWSISFVLGLSLGSGLLHTIFDIPVPELVDESGWLIALSGLLVGFGTSLGNGCTSGHGVCGIGRLSLRSTVATLVFMLAAIITVKLSRVFFN